MMTCLVCGAEMTDAEVDTLVSVPWGETACYKCLNWRLQVIVEIMLMRFESGAEFQLWRPQLDDYA